MLGLAGVILIALDDTGTDYRILVRAVVRALSGRLVDRRHRGIQRPSLAPTSGTAVGGGVRSSTAAIPTTRGFSRWPEQLRSPTAGARRSATAIGCYADWPIRPRWCAESSTSPLTRSPSGGRYTDPTAAVDHGLAMIRQGAKLLDIGGQSTRPGSPPPSVAEEIARVVPVIDRLARSASVPISIDTSRPAVMRAAVAAGGCFINDVRA